MNGRPAELFSSYNTLAELMAELEPIIVAPWRLGVLAGSRDSVSSWQLILTRLFVSYKLHGPIFLMAFTRSRVCRVSKIVGRQAGLMLH